jgi:DNA primase
MNTTDIERLRNIPIEEVAERLGLEVRHHKSLCPFHDDSHPSLTYNRRYNRYRCFVCDAHGDTINLVMAYMHKSFVEACAWLGADNVFNSRFEPKVKQRSSYSFDVALWERRLQRIYLSKEAVDFLFFNRRLHPAVVRWLGVSSSSTHLLFPYRDIDGKLRTVQWRYMGNDKSRPRFYFPKGSRCTIYNMPILNMLKEGEPLYVSEGVTDCMALLSAGKKAIAIPSATLLNDEDLGVLKSDRFKGLNLHIYPDRDAPGERLYLNLKDHFPRIERHQLPTDCKDFSEYYVKHIVKSIEI